MKESLYVSFTRC